MRSGRTLLTLFVLSMSPMAFACTVCHSPTAQQVRAGIFGSNFAGRLLLIASPFPLLALAIVAVHVGMPDLDDLPDLNIRRFSAGRRVTTPQDSPS